MTGCAKQIERWIARAEEAWLEPLLEHGASVFAYTHLPSHDHTHHRRVWHHCRSLLRELSAEALPERNRTEGLPDETLVEGLLVAACFHDLGTAVTLEEAHGKESRLICESYFRGNRGRPARFEEILDAVEKHDVKEGRGDLSHTAAGEPGILAILSVADDLEALGTIGIYRYAEIYLKRGTSLQRLGTSVLANAAARTGYIVSARSGCREVTANAVQRYGELSRFYDLYNQQLLTAEEPEAVRSGHLGVVRLIRTLSLEGGVAPEDFPVKAREMGAGTFEQDFFRNLKHELESV